MSAIYRDRRGILWIGTQQGLHRFDGATLTVFNSDRNNQHWIPESEINDITEDSDGNLLVATSGGFLLKFNPHTEIFDSIKQFDPIGKTSLIRLLASKDGSIWLLSKERLILYDARFQNPQDWVMRLDLSGTIGSFNDILEDESGNIWVGGSLGIAKVVTEKRTSVSFNLETLQLPEDARVTALGINSEGNLIVGTDTGHLLVWGIGENKPLANDAIAGNSPNYISDFVLYGDILIVATDRGLFASDGHFSFMKNLSDQGDGLSNNDIYRLFRDGNHIWIGTIDGLDILSFSAFELLNSKNSGVSNTILAFEQDIKGRIWVGTYSGLYLYDDATFSHVRDNFISHSNSPTGGEKGIATIASRKSELWLGLIQYGVKVVNVVSGKTLTPNVINSDIKAITKILADEHSEDLWIATHDSGLFHITAAGTHSYNDDQTLPEKTITLLFQPKTGGILVVSENRVYQHNPQIDQFSEIQFDFDLEGTRPFVYSIIQTYNDDILIGTKDHGLFVWSRENQIKNRFTLQAMDRSDLTTSTIYGIEQDSSRNLWCSTQNGIVKLDSKGQLIKRFTTADGLQGNDFTLGASFQSREGLIYFGGVNGYNRFNPIEVSIDSSPSPMRLTGISLPKQDDRNMGAVNDLKSLQLTHTDHFVTFQFSVLDFISPERNQFRYKLDNFDLDWIDSGTRNTATYTNLPAGEYVLHVQGANSAGIWNRKGLTLDVRVLPPPWLTWWSFCLYGVLLLLFVWSAHRVYHSYAIDRKSARLAKQMFEAANKADDDMQEQLEIQDELVQSAYQHNLTTLSLVSSFISHRSSNHQDEVIRDLTESSVKRIAALSSLEDCLYFQAGSSVGNLYEYTERIIPVLLKSSPITPEKMVTINEVTSTLLPAELATPLSIIIYELLENSFQHAFPLQSPANYLHIKLVFDATYGSPSSGLNLTVRDSGIGLPDSIENLAAEGSGIAIVQSIVKTLGGTLQCSGTTGTTISMTLPNPGDSDIPYDPSYPS